MTSRPSSTYGKRPGPPDRQLPEGAGGKVADLALPNGPSSRLGRLTAGSRGWTWGAWTATSPPSWNRTGRRWDRAQAGQLLLGFLATEVVPLANRLAELGIDPTPLFATTSGILRLYADTLDHPDPRQ